MNFFRVALSFFTLMLSVSVFSADALPSFHDCFQDQKCFLDKLKKREPASLRILAPITTGKIAIPEGTSEEESIKIQKEYEEDERNNYDERDFLNLAFWGDVELGSEQDTVSKFTITFLGGSILAPAVRPKALEDFQSNFKNLEDVSLFLDDLVDPIEVPGRISPDLSKDDIANKIFNSFVDDTSSLDENSWLWLGFILSKVDSKYNCYSDLSASEEQKLSQEFFFTNFSDYSYSFGSLPEGISCFDSNFDPFGGGSFSLSISGNSSDIEATVENTDIDLDSSISAISGNVSDIENTDIDTENPDLHSSASDASESVKYLPSTGYTLKRVIISTVLALIAIFLWGLYMRQHKK